MDENIIRVGCALVGAMVGAYINYMHNRLRTVEEAVVAVDNSIPTPEEMAQEVLKVKLPINKVPKEALANLERAMGQMKKPTVTTPDYMG